MCLKGKLISDCCFNAKSTIYKLYHDNNKLLLFFADICTINVLNYSDVQNVFGHCNIQSDKS